MQLQQLSSMSFPPSTSNSWTNTAAAEAKVAAYVDRFNDPIEEGPLFVPRNPRPLPGAKPQKGRLIPFPQLLYQVLEQASEQGFDKIISWEIHGRAFRVYNTEKLEQFVLPKYFATNKYASFVRQVNIYRFLRVDNGPDKGSWFHEYLLRGRPDLTLCIRRERPSRKSSIGTSNTASTSRNENRASSRTRSINFYRMPICSAQAASKVRQSDAGVLLPSPSMCMQATLNQNDLAAATMGVAPSSSGMILASGGSSHIGAYPVQPEPLQQQLWNQEGPLAALGFQNRGGSNDIKGAINSDQNLNLKMPPVASSASDLSCNAAFHGGGRYYSPQQQDKLQLQPADSHFAGVMVSQTETMSASRSYVNNSNAGLLLNAEPISLRVFEFACPVANIGQLCASTGQYHLEADTKPAAASNNSAGSSQQNQLEARKSFY